jgi:hypothetical protein
MSAPASILLLVTRRSASKVLLDVGETTSPPFVNGVLHSTDAGIKVVNNPFMFLLG